jgi:hypothetical protein
MSGQEDLGVLSSLEIDRLEGLAAELDLFRFSLRDFIKSLSGARETSVRYQVNERLRCVVLDSISPAIADLSNIAETARGAVEEDEDQEERSIERG